MRVGVFDSGIGGLTFLRKAIQLLPKEDYFYYADTQNAPYGEKTEHEVYTHIRNAIRKMDSLDLHALVMACNTATGVAIERLRAMYSFPIIGMEPAVKPAVEYVQGTCKRVLVVATRLALREQKFKQLLKKVDVQNRVDVMALPLLVEYAEKLDFCSEHVHRYIENALHTVNLEKIGAVVLGCTHFPYFEKVFRAYMPQGVVLMDGGTGTANRLYRVLGEQGRIGEGASTVTFYQSGQEIKDRTVVATYRTLCGMKTYEMTKQDVQTSIQDTRLTEVL